MSYAGMLARGRIGGILARLGLPAARAAHHLRAIRGLRRRRLRFTSKLVIPLAVLAAACAGLLIKVLG